MIKRFCDCCKLEMTERTTPSWGDNGARVGVAIDRNGVKLGVQVIQFVNGTANAGDVCTHCILDALYALDDRDVMRVVRP